MVFVFDGFANGPTRNSVSKTEVMWHPPDSNDVAAVFKSFPVFMGCVDHRESEDVFCDMYWVMNSSRSPMVVTPELPNSLLYMNNHNEPVGELWKAHHRAFGRFVKTHMKGSGVYEVGGAHGLASLEVVKKYGIQWVIHDLNPIPVPDYSGEVIKGAFTAETARLDSRYQTIAHSHTLEHVHDPYLFLAEISRVLPVGGRHIISWPNMDAMLERCDLNFLNFEHTVFLPKKTVLELLTATGFRMVRIEPFQRHSWFIAVEKVSNTIGGRPPVDDFPMDLFDRYFASLSERAEQMRSAIENYKGHVYAFGAHVFTQMLIAAGLPQAQLSAVLDNSKSKQGRRLFGTNLRVVSPEAALSETGGLVVMAVAEYEREIRSQLSQIQPEVEIVSL